MYTKMTTKSMKKIKVKRRYIVLLIFLIIVLFIRHVAWASLWYSLYFYPFFSWCLSYTSRFWAFSLGDLFIAISVTVLVSAWGIRRLLNRRNRISKKKLLGYEVEYLLWIYVWFYLSWGINYSQPNFYRRAKVNAAPYSEAAFRSFVDDYVHDLNVSYCPVKGKHTETVRREVLAAYRKMGKGFGINPPGEDAPPVKRMMFPRLISSVGVTGYMGPFFAEYNLNSDLLPINYPFTYAHEFSHWLGITNESEANLYAYFACTHSRVRSVRYSGYFSILGYVLSNARRIYKPDEYKKLRSSILPQIRYQYDVDNAYWRGKYSTIIGGAQDYIYDLYLRNNNMPSGLQSYSEVINLILSCRANKTNKYLNE